MVKLYEAGQDGDMFYYVAQEIPDAECVLEVQGMTTLGEVLAFNEEGKLSDWGFIPDSEDWQKITPSRDAAEVQRLYEEDGLAFPCRYTIILESLDELPADLREDLGR